MPLLRAFRFARPPSTTERYRTSWRRGVPPLVDVAEPSGAPLGTVVLVHGGGFVVGSRRGPAMANMARAVTEAGFVALAVDYRLLGRGGRFETSLQDVLDAVAWARRHAEQGGRDPDRIGIMGASAGAALASIAAAETNARAFVGVYGPYDFTTLPGQPVVRSPTRWLLSSTDPAVLHRVSPLTRATTLVPTLLLHGDRDVLVPPRHSRALEAARAAKGAPTRVVILEGARHGFLAHPQTAAASRATALATAFLAEHLA